MKPSWEMRKAAIQVLSQKEKLAKENAEIEKKHLDIVNKGISDAITHYYAP